MSNLGPIYEDDEHYSPARANAKGITRDTGTNLVALATTKQLGAVCPTDTSGGLVKNVTYIVDYDSSFNRIQFLPIFHRHTHSATNDDEDGGGLLYIVNENLLEFIEVNWVAHQSSPSGFWNFSNLNATLTLVQASNDSYHLIDTLSTTGNYGTATMGGARIEFDDTINLLFQTDLNRNSNLLTRLGINVDRVQDTPSTSRRMIGLEGCDGHGTNWVMLNANGNTGSLVVTATTAPLNSGGDNTYLIVHEPAQNQILYYNGVSMATSITNIADDGGSERSRLFRWGVKLPTGTLNIQQQMFYVRITGNQKVFE